METKSKGMFGKLIDIADSSDTDINIAFVSHQDVQLNIIQKDTKSSETKEKDNKDLASLLSDVKSGFKQHNIPLNITQGNGEKQKHVITGQKPCKASLSEAEVALQKMQLQAQALGAELVLTDRPAVMAEERWVLPEISPQESRTADLPVVESLAKLAAAIKTVTDKCPLQITLMIRPDLRPQVMINVVASGGVNWIFAAKEGRYPLSDLLAKMAGKTVTHGWDAIVVYQRGQANNLLQQQHIKRFTTGNTLAPVNEDIESSTATRLLTHNLTLSAPHLSFNKAGSGDSTAQVAMDFVKGMIVYKEKSVDDSYRIMRIEKITPLNSPYVAMDVPLSKAPGSVSEIGEVQFDIKEGDHFTNNLVVNGMEQETISNFFKRRFVATPAEQRIYKLGKFDNFKNEQFQPEEFVIRTMGAPNTASRGSEDDGDGAVVLFVQVKNGSKEPGKTEVDWLLADDYQSSLVVSSYQLFDKMVREQSLDLGGGNLIFSSYLADEGKAGKIQAINGVIHNDYEYMFHPTPKDNYTFSRGGLCTSLYKNENGSVIVPLTLRSSYSENDKSDICCEYKMSGYDGGILDGHKANSFYHMSVVGEDEEFSKIILRFFGYCQLDVSFKAIYSPVINDDVINFVYNPTLSTYELLLSKHRCLYGCDDLDQDTIDMVMNLSTSPKMEQL
ncbi:hypothetical protein F9883_14610 [Morganella morganii]|uniref:hypothetical protein n=1 Tax=Morganella morganii TaxID=582 RepID=UPI0015F469A4|nr:hypothetical protein [Morganella morganii]MBA5809099.1 hypothetical protein [Morganella morganii]